MKRYYTLEMVLDNNERRYVTEWVDEPREFGTETEARAYCADYFAKHPNTKVRYFEVTEITEEKHSMFPAPEIEEYIVQKLDGTWFSTLTKPTLEEAMKVKQASLAANPNLNLRIVKAKLTVIN